MIQFNDGKKEGTVEFVRVYNPGMGKRAEFRLTLTKPVEATDTFERSDIKWSQKTKKAIGIGFSNYGSIPSVFGYSEDIVLTVPQEIIDYIIKTDDEKKEEIRLEKVNQDFEFTLNDTDSYGIYNGISEFSIESLVSELKKQYPMFLYIFNDDIAKILSRDEELKKIAMDTYEAYPINENWLDEVKEWHINAAKKKRAPGYGTIPNIVIREKINKLLSEEYNKEKTESENEENRVNELIEKAKETGEKQLISKWTEPCNDPHEECSTDICYYWAMPDGTKKETRHHTW